MTPVDRRVRTTHAASLGVGDAHLFALGFRMRILHVLNHIERLSGNVHAAIDLACAQAQSGHSVTVVARGTGDFERLLTSCGVDFVPLDIRRTFKKLFNAELDLLKLIKTWRPDVVHAHMMTSALLAAPLCKWLGRPLVTSVHNAFERSAIFMALGRRIVAVSEKVGESLRQKGFPASRVRVVLNGTIGSARLRTTRDEEVQLRHPALLFVGGLHPRKGVADLLQAFASLSARGVAAHLYIVGEGPHRGSYEELTKRLDLADRVTFCGGSDDPSAFMRSADIFVLCSHADPAPLVISEAREAGCAIVATDVDGIPEMLEYGEAGLLVAPSSPLALSDAIAPLLQNEATLDQWKRRSQINIERLELRRVVEDMDQVYRDALRTGEPARQRMLPRSKAPVERSL